MKDVPLSQLTLAKFSELLNTRFRVQTGPSDSVELELVQAVPGREVAPVGAAQAAPRNESFSLIFNGPGEQFLEQRIYSFEQEQIGRFDLFIVPIGRDKGGFQYQAVFNRLVSAC